MADSIALVGWNLRDQARRYVAWWHMGDYSVNGRCFDIGKAAVQGADWYDPNVHPKMRSFAADYGVDVPPTRHNGQSAVST